MVTDNSVIGASVEINCVDKPNELYATAFFLHI